jgi:hypothetical protein
MAVRTRPSMVEARMTKAVTIQMRTPKQAFAVSVLFRVWIVCYISVIPTWRKDIDNSSMEHTIYVQIYLQIPIDLLDQEVKP